METIKPLSPRKVQQDSERYLTTETKTCQDRAKAEARTKGSWIPEGTTDADLSWGVISGPGESNWAFKSEQLWGLPWWSSG